jgi:hypothetical protein
MTGSVSQSSLPPTIATPWAIRGRLSLSTARTWSPNILRMKVKGPARNRHFLGICCHEVELNFYSCKNNAGTD